jgi:hypothetical protein
VGLVGIARGVYHTFTERVNDKQAVGILDSGFSSIAVDDKDNEVAMTDENLFQIVTYDRLTCWY